MQLEIELKLTIHPENAKLLDQHPFILGHLASTPQYYDLLSTYFDTTDCCLQKNGWSLRVREWDGQYIQTLKSSGKQIDDLHHRHEWDQPIQDTNPNLELFENNALRQQITQLIHQKPLVVLFQTRFIRKQWDLKFPDGAFVELVLDQGKVTTNNHHEPISEIEIELKTGNPNKLNEIADILRQTIPLTVETRSKAERGYQLCAKATS
jgi:inorganic triphosphatase YgiF